MSNIDERIARLELDNAQFEKASAETLRSLNQLDKGLELKNADRGIRQLEQSMSGLSFSGLANGVAAIQGRFSALGTFAGRIVEKIADDCYNAGKRMVTAFTIDPIKSGFQEYETQINSVQTILANTESKGSTLDDVNKALDELNLYADKTIYNFTEMTRNIGTFTAAGVDLDTSVSAIKGIANLAAVSGSTSQQASTAMYQLSQALASGTVKLQDWNSVVNAGMGGQVFQDALKETARAHGVAIDQMIEDQGSFRETLKKGWLTSDVLTETLSKFTGDLSEAQLAEMGYTEDQIAEIVKMGQTANDAATKVKTFTQLFDTLKEAAQSGWTQSWEIIVGDFEEAKTLLTEVSDAFSNVIGESANRRNELLERALGDGSRSLASHKQVMDQLKSTTVEIEGAFKTKAMTGRELLIDSVRNALIGLGKVLDAIKGAWQSVFPPTTAKQLYGLLNSIHNFSANLVLSDEALQKVGSAFKGVFSVLKLGATIVTSVAKGFGTIVKALLPFTGGILDASSSLGDFLSNLSSSIIESGVIEETVSTIVDLVLNAGKNIKNFFTMLGDKLNFPSFDELKKKFSELTGGANSVRDKIGSAFSDLLEKLKGFKEDSSSIFDKIKEGFVAFSAKAKEIFEKLKEVLSPIFEKIKETWSNITITDIFKTGLLGGLFVLLKDLASGKKKVTETLGDFIGGISEILDTARGALEAWQNNLKAKTLLKIAAAVGILAISLLTIASVDGESLANGILGIGALLAEVVGAMTALDKLKVSKQGGNALAILVIAAAISILASALKKLEEFQTWDETWPALTALLVLLGGIGAFAVVLGKAKLSGNLIATGLGVMLVAGAMQILSSALIKVSELKPDEIEAGLITIGGLLAEIGIYAKVVDGAKVSGIVGLAAGILILYKATELFGTMDQSVLDQGLNAVNTLILLLGVASGISGLTKGGSGPILAMALAITALIIPIRTFAEMYESNRDSLNAAITTVATLIGTITMAVGALAIIGSAGGNLAGVSVAVLAVGGALILLATAMKILDTVKPETIAMGVAAFIGVMAGFGALTMLLAPFSGTLLLVSGAIALLGVGALSVGVGIMALAAGLGSLILLGPAAGAAITALVVAMAQGLALAIPTIISSLIYGFGMILQSITALIPQVTELIRVLITSILDLLIEVGPDIVETALVLIETLLTSIEEHLPSILEKGTAIVLALMDGISEALPQLVDKAAEIIISLLNSLGDTLEERTPEILEAAAHVIEGLVTGLKDAVVELGPGAIEKVKEFALDVINGLGEKISECIDTVKGFAKDIIDGLIGGIRDKIEDVKNACKEVTDAITGKIKDILDIHSPSRLMRDEVGQPIVEGIAEGITKNTSAEEAAKKKAENIANAFKEEIDKFDMAQSVNDLEYELWSKVNERTATDGEKAGMNMVHMQKNYQLQSQSVKLAQEEYEYTVRELGQTSEQATEAYKKLLQARIDLADMWNDIQDGWDDMKKTRKGKNYGPGVDEQEQSEQQYYDYGYNMGASLDSGFNAYMSDKMEGATDASGTSIGTAFSEGLLATSGVNVDSVGQVMTDTLTRVQQEQPNWVSTGANLAQGLADGIISGKATVISAAAGMASEALAAANAALGVESPSKEFRETGMYAGEGLAMGLDKMTDRVGNRAKSIAQNALDVCKDVMSGINAILTGEDAVPVISPVIDLSNVSDSAAQMESIFGNRYGATSYTGRLLRSNYDTAESRRSAMAEKASYDSNAGLITEIRALGERMDGISAAVSNMKVVMNANALVGQIQQPMDSKLGKASKYRQRGV